METNFHDKLTEYQSELISYACSIPEEKPDSVIVFVNLITEKPGQPDVTVSPWPTVMYYTNGSLYGREEIKRSRRADDYFYEMTVSARYIAELFKRNGMEVPQGVRLELELKTSRFKCEFYYEEKDKPREWHQIVLQGIEDLKKRYNA